MTVMRTFLLASLCVTRPPLLAAQRPAIAPAPSVLFQRAEPAAPSPSPTPTYWKEGALIGGIPLGILGFALANGLCGSGDGGSGDHCTLAGLGGAAFGFLTGAVVGSLIGGQIPKHE